MRNVGSKLHMPSREWKKVVRFNSCDYILRSVYDGTDRKRKPKYITTTKDLDALDSDDYDTLLENFFGDAKPSRPVSKKDDDEDDEFESGVDFGSDEDDDWDFTSSDDDSDNSFFNDDEDVVDSDENSEDNEKEPEENSGRDDSVWDLDDSFNDNVYGDFDDICSLMQADAVDVVYNSTEYNLTKEDGTEMPVRLSENTYVNAIYYILEPLVLVANDTDASTHSKIDNFMYASGRRNNKVSYKIDINDIVFKDGTLKFIIGGDRVKGFIHVYYVDNKNIDFTIKYPNININGKKDTVVLNYSLFCHLIDSNPLTMKKKQPSQYFKPIVTETMEYFRNKGIGIKLLKAHPSLSFHSLSSAPKSVATFKDNFDIVANYGEKDYGDINIMKNAVDESCSLLSGVFYNSFNDAQEFVDDENYVIIGGNERFFSEYINSSISNFSKNSSFINIQFKTPDPKNRIRKIEHNMMLMPLSRFMLASSSMLLNLLSNQI